MHFFHFGRKPLKGTLLFLNSLCVTLAVLLLWFGVWLLGSIEDLEIDNGERLASVLIILLGVVISLVAIYGFTAVYKESKCMLIAYAVILVALLVVQLTLLSISYAAAAGGLGTGLQQGFDELWERGDNKNGTLARYEEWLQCCGKHSAEDYFLLEKVPPASCCKDRDCTNVLNLFVVGCERKFQEYVSSKTGYLNAISWSIIAVELVGSIAACALVDNIRNHRDRMRFYS